MGKFCIENAEANRQIIAMHWFLSPITIHCGRISVASMFLLQAAESNASFYRSIPFFSLQAPTTS